MSKQGTAGKGKHRSFESGGNHIKVMPSYNVWLKTGSDVKKGTN